MTVSNNAFWELLGSIGASTTTMTIKDSKWGLFPTSYPYKLTLEQLDSNNLVTKREIVTVTNKVADTFTITRASEACPLNDTATTQTQIAQSFIDWALVQLRLTADWINQIWTDITSLWTTKLDKTTYNAEKIAYASTTTWNDDYAITVPDIVAYNIGQTFKVKADVWNTWTATLNVNSLWAKTLKKLKSSAFSDLETWDIITNQIFWATYNGTDFQFSVDPANVSIPDVASTKSTFISWENITAWNALYISDYDTVVWNTPTAWWSINYFWDTTYNKQAQSFTVASNYTNISKIELSPYKNWSPTDNVAIRIETDNAWSPSWTLADANATLTITSWELTTSEVIITKTFTPFNLNTWTYWIVYSRSSTLDNTNKYALRRNTPDYAWWTVKAYNWSAWALIDSPELKDTYFKIYQTSWKAYKTDASNSSKINFIWFATNTVSSWWNVIVDTAWVSNTQTWLTVWSDYYLSWGGTLTSQLLTSTQINIWYSTSTYNYKEWQTFQLSSWTNWIKIITKLRKVWSPTDNILIKLYASNKTTLLWTSNSISWTTLTTWWIDYTFTISWVNLLASTEYFISVERDWANSTSNYYLIDVYTNASNVYPNWATYTYNNWTSTWDAYVSWGDYTDFYFSIIQDWNWAISTTPWSNVKYIWTATSSTSIVIRPNWLKWTTWTTVWAAWWATALPATPLWYVTTSVNWLTVKIPYYNI